MDIINLNFFNLSFSSQIKVLELYLSNVDGSEYDKVFERYMLVVRKLLEFKDRFSCLSVDDRKKMRDLIGRYKDKINSNSVFVSEDNFYCDSLIITDSVVNDYINKNEFDPTSFFDYYSYVFDYDFSKILGLCRHNRDFFNEEIKELSNDFYSLYINLNTIDRMKCIWYLANFEEFSSDKFNESWKEKYSCFEGDSTFIKPLHRGSREGSRVLSKFFNVKG